MKEKKILIIRFSSLGDIILLSPLFRETKKRLPNSRIDFLTSTTFSTVCANNPNINRIIALDRKKGNIEFKKILAQVKSEDYDLIIDAHCSLRSRLMLFWLLGPMYWLKKSVVSINKRSFKRNLLLATKVNLFKDGAISQREAYCQLLDPLVSDQNYQTSTELFPDSSDIRMVSELLKEINPESKPIIALGPAASFEGKCWPQESFAELAIRYSKSGYCVVLIGADTDREPKWIAEKRPKEVVNLAGRFTFLQTAAFLGHCQLTVSNDSAVIHFSEAVGTPAIAVFGPTVQEFGYAPYLKDSKTVELNLSCRPCSRNGKGDCKNRIDRQCLKEISVDQVWEVSKEILQK